KGQKIVAAGEPAHRFGERRRVEMHLNPRTAQADQIRRTSFTFQSTKSFVGVREAKLRPPIINEQTAHHLDRQEQGERAEQNASAAALASVGRSGHDANLKTGSR